MHQQARSQNYTSLLAFHRAAHPNKTPYQRMIALSSSSNIAQSIRRKNYMNKVQRCVYADRAG